jgi:hypothetical protein
MRRVRTIYILRQIFSPTSMKIVMLFAVLKESFSVVSVPNVLANSPSLLNPIASYQFFTSAFLNTELVVRILLVATLALTLWLIRDLLSKPSVFGYQNLKKI